MLKDKRSNPLKDYIQIFAQAMIINNLNTPATRIHEDFLSHISFINQLDLKLRNLLPSKTKINIRTVQRLLNEIKGQFNLSYYKKSVFYIWDENSFESFSMKNPEIVLRANYISSKLFGRHLWEHEAKWVDKLAPFTKTLDPIPALILSKEYSLREEYHFLINGDSEIQHQDTFDLDTIISLQPWDNHIEEQLLRNILFSPTLIMSPFNESKYDKIKLWILLSLYRFKKNVVYDTNLWDEEGNPLSWKTISGKFTISD